MLQKMQKPGNASGNEMERLWEREIRLPLRLRGRTGLSPSLFDQLSPSLSATYAWRFFMMTKIEKRSCGKSSRAPSTPLSGLLLLWSWGLLACV